jgi:hypothetical protein
MTTELENQQPEPMDDWPFPIKETSPSDPVSARVEDEIDLTLHATDKFLREKGYTVEEIIPWLKCRPCTAKQRVTAYRGFKELSPEQGAELTWAVQGCP